MRSHRGFVLVAVLAMLVVLALLAGTIALVAQRSRDATLERQRLLQDSIDMASTRATVVYLLATQRMTFGGLTVDDRIVLSEDERAALEPGETAMSFMPTGNEIALDGTMYGGLGDIRFSLQDDRGLIAVNWCPPAWLERFVEQARGPDSGMSGDLPIESLRNRLLDYQDPDDLYRINSVEADGYQALGLPRPANAALSTPLELRRVAGWHEALALLGDTELAGTVSVVRSAQLNVNTAPRRVLQSLPGVDAAAAQRVVDARLAGPFIHLSGFYQLVGGMPADENALSLYPLPSGTLKLWPGGGGAVQLMHWTLTPLDEGGRPWREDYEFTLPQDGEPAGTVPRVAATPLFSVAPAAAE